MQYSNREEVPVPTIADLFAVMKSSLWSLLARLDLLTTNYRAPALAISNALKISRHVSTEEHQSYRLNYVSDFNLEEL